MCNFTPLRNWLYGTVAAVGWAVSSAWFSYYWWSYPVVGRTCWTITLIATLAALVAISNALSAANSFCACVAAVKACTTACMSVRGALIAAYAPLVGLMVVAVAALANAIGTGAALTALYLISAAFAVLTIYVVVYVGILANCQTPPAPAGGGR